MGIGQVSGPRPGGNGDNGEKCRVNLWGLAGTRGSCTLVTHKGDRNHEIKPFRGREGVPPTIVPVLFTPVFPPSRGVGRRSLVDNEGRCTETDEGKNCKKTEDPVGEDICTTKRLGVVAKLCEESVGVRCNIRFRWFLLLDGILSKACPYLSDGFPSRDVVSGNDKERCRCEERG